MKPQAALGFREPVEWSAAELKCAETIPGWVSVVIPAHNAAKTIGDTLRSCWWQTRWPDEVVVVDDHSQDCTPAVLDEEMAACFEVVRLSRNCGPAAARNVGVRWARGEFIVYIDADDIMPPERIAECLCEFNEGADMVYGQKEYFDGDDWQDRFSRNHVDPPTVRNFLGSGCGASTVSVRRSLHTERGIWWDERMSVAEDAELLLQCLSAGVPIKCSDNVYSWVRLSENSLTRHGDWGSMRAYMAQKHEVWISAAFGVRR